MAVRKRRTKKPTRREVSCYYCRHAIDVSSMSMSTACPNCHKAIKIEDVVIKTYLPVNDLLTCGEITVTRRGRVVARNIHAGNGITCEGTIEGEVVSEGTISLGPKSEWKGKMLSTDHLEIAEGATMVGRICVPLQKDE